MNTITQREHELTAHCWCTPKVTPVHDGVLIIHNDALGVALGLEPQRIEPAQ